ncbi:MAG: glycosyltransferase [Candidatus Omnitrophica bacterium]|nr:glycosyltransferase [Candidatus Omnitrophota bacterium]
MKILIMTNTYKPVLGGLERSIEIAAGEYRKRGHEVLIVCPEYKKSQHEEGVLRIPALKDLGENKFSLQIPVPGIEDKILKKFIPDIIHLQHPFLIAESALRISEKNKIPLVLTYHTLFEQNLDHYLPVSLDIMKKFIIKLFTGFAELCDAVIAPSDSIKDLLKEEHQVKTQIEVIPTGIYVKQYDKFNKADSRRRLGIHPDIKLIGFISRISKEKNLDFLVKAVSLAMKKDEDLHFLVAGKGNYEEEIKNHFHNENLNSRFHYVGILEGDELICAYDALDAFVYASKSETQGLVLAEAMASGVPVIALDAPGVRDIVKDGVNGFLINEEKSELFAEKIIDYFSIKDKNAISKNALKTAQEYSVEKCINKILSLFNLLIENGKKQERPNKSNWEKHLRGLKTEIELLSNLGDATKTVFGDKK